MTSGALRRRRLLLLGLIWLAALTGLIRGLDFFGTHHAGRPGEVPPTYYKTLGLPRSCSEQEIKQAYRKKAMKMHPDKGGDPEAFKALAEAYEILSDPTKRADYDRFGRAGATGTSSHSPQHHAGGDFSSFFRSFGMPATVYHLVLPLEDLYTGRTVTLNVGGTLVRVCVKPGMMEGMQIRVALEDQELMLVVQEEKHAMFTRKNADLYTEIRVSLLEALCGFNYSITLLNGEVATLTHDAVIQPGGVLVFPQLGMPLYNPDQSGRERDSPRGRLFVRIHVELPRAVKLSATETQLLRRVFPHQDRGQPKKPVAVGTIGDLNSFGATGAWHDGEFPFANMFR